MVKLGSSSFHICRHSDKQARAAICLLALTCWEFSPIWSWSCSAGWEEEAAAAAAAAQHQIRQVQREREKKERRRKKSWELQIAVNSSLKGLLLLLRLPPFPLLPLLDYCQGGILVEIEVLRLQKKVRDKDFFKQNWAFEEGIVDEESIVISKNWSGSKMPENTRESISNLSSILALI